MIFCAKCSREYNEYGVHICLGPIEPPASPEQGRKNDEGKPAMALIPPLGEIEEAKAMGYGAKKYGQYNYLGGLTSTRLVSAAKRHLNAFIRGEDLDPESGISHLGHAKASIGMLIEMLERHPELDDRYKGTK